NAAVTGTFTATSDANDVAVSLSALSVRRVTVTRRGGGTGTVTSSPSGMTCPDNCSGLYLGAVTLTAVPDPGSLVGAWSDGIGLDCHAGLDCVVPTGGFVVLGLRLELASTAKAVSIAFAGPGSGRATLQETVIGEYLACAGPCTIYYAP